MNEARGQRNSFSDARFESVVAHGGRASIQAARVIERSGKEGLAYIDLVVVPPDGDIGVHTHDPDDEEIYIVIEGHGRIVVDGTWGDAVPGDVFVNRPGGSHGLENSGTAPMRLVVIDIRVGLKS